MLFTDEEVWQEEEQGVAAHGSDEDGGGGAETASEGSGSGDWAGAVPAAAAPHWLLGSGDWGLP